MGLFWTARDRVDPSEAKRSLDPWTTLPALRAMPSTFATADPNSFAGSLQSVAVRSTIDLICSLGSELPIEIYEGIGADRTKVKAPSYFADLGGDGHGTPDWIYQVLMSWLARGNLYGQTLERSRKGGFQTQMSVYFPDFVSMALISGRAEWHVSGKPADDMANFVHRRVNPVPGTVLGLSPVQMHASTVGVSLASTEFGRQFFTDGAHPSAMLTSDQQLTEEKAGVAKQRFMDALRGKREPVVLGAGWKYQNLQLSPDESQFLQTQGYAEAQCARIFGPGFAEILGYDSGGNMTYSNIESRATHLLVFGMNRWLTRMDRVLSEFLPATQYARIDRDAMLESTTLTRYEAWSSALAARWKTVNEVRAAEDMPPVAWGDQPNLPIRVTESIALASPLDEPTPQTAKEAL